MKRQQLLKHRLQTLATLSDTVGAMRSLSAHHFRRARHALETARTYRSEMDQVIAEIGIHQVVHQNATAGLLIVTSDLGLCGDYNAQLARMTVATADNLAAPVVYSVGRRARGSLVHGTIAPDRACDAPASLEGISQLLLSLAANLLDDYVSRRIGSLDVIAARFDGVGHFTPLVTRVLPIAPVAAADPLRRSPYVNPDALSAAAVREFLDITLYEILLDSQAAEHGMRLMAAESALEWLDTTSTTTARRLASARSEASTQELLDIVSGGRQHAQGNRS